MKNYILPYEPKYRIWNSKKTASLVLLDPDLQKYIVIRDEYVFNLNTVAVYNYRDQPLAGKYKCVIFDKQDGIILCSLNTKQILNRSVKDGYGGILFHKTISDELGFRYYHTISFGHTAFFSTRGYVGNSATDWAGLHNIANYNTRVNNLILDSVPIKGLTYSFTYNDCTTNIGHHLSNALKLNEVSHQFVHDQIEMWGYEGYKNCALGRTSMLGNRFYRRVHQRPSVTASEIMERVNCKSHMHLLHTYNDSAGMPDQYGDYRVAYTMSKRIRSVQ